MSFFTDIQKFTDKTERAALMVFRGTSLDIFSKVIQRTPVDTGRLRGNWQASLNSPISGETESTESMAINKAQTTVGNTKISDSIYMVNNLPYAEGIENGRSDQAPAGMVKVTIAEYQEIVKENARKAKK